MSYYDIQGHGTFPLSNGFGDQQGDVFRAKILNTNCLSICNFILFPYCESFESYLGGWKQVDTENFDWTRNSGSTPSYNTVPSSAEGGSFYV